VSETAVVLDVDTGIDDALALMLAVRHTALDVRAVTCTGGNVPLRQVVENTLAVLALAGGERIPVAAGAHRPLIETPRDAGYIHGCNGVADLHLPAHGLRPVDMHAVDLLLRTIQTASAPITLIALAPLTNIALLLRTHPEVAGGIERIVFMGGAVGSGNATAAAEFNVWHDPEAAAIVLDSGIPTTMYGLEPFYRVTCDADTIGRLRDNGAALCTRIAGGLLAHLARVTEDESRIPEAGSAAIGDAGAVCAVIAPEGLTTVDAPVSVALAPGPTRGQTVVDLRNGLGAGGEVTAGRSGGVRVVTDVDHALYRDIFLDAIAPPVAAPSSVSAERRLSPSL